MKGREVLVERSPGVSDAELGGEIVGLHIPTGTCYRFNGTATRVWQLLDRPRTKAELCRALCEEFDVAEAVCSEKLDTILAGLARDGLVRLAPLAA